MVVASDAQNTPHYLVVGDIQGCYSALMRLLDKAGFCERKHILVSVGDMIARGEDSLATLRFLHGLGAAFQAVLGNHDLHLLAVSQGIRQAKASDRLSSLLASEHLPDYVTWLRQWPLARRLDENTLVVHAGLYPQWSIDDAICYSNEVSTILRGDDWPHFLALMYGNQPTLWSDRLEGPQRYRFIINAFTRMRFIYPNLALEFECKESPEQTTGSLVPWFNATNDKLTPHERVIFGHWASLMGQTNHRQFVGTDHGVVWGGSLCGYWYPRQEKVLVSAL